MTRIPFAQSVVFAALAGTGVALVALADDVLPAAQASLVSALGAAVFAAALAFFLVEVFAWDRARRAT